MPPKKRTASDGLSQQEIKNAQLRRENQQDHIEHTQHSTHAQCITTFAAIVDEEGVQANQGIDFRHPIPTGFISTNSRG